MLWKSCLWWCVCVALVLVRTICLCTTLVQHQVNAKEPAYYRTELPHQQPAHQWKFIDIAVIIVAVFILFRLAVCCWSSCLVAAVAVHLFRCNMLAVASCGLCQAQMGKFVRHHFSILSTHRQLIVQQASSNTGIVSLNLIPHGSACCVCRCSSSWTFVIL